MKISCIIPTKDRAAMVLEAIASVINQQAVVDEIIVVDDGSTDNTGKGIREKYPEVKLLRLSGKGPGPARNAGAAAASGNVLMFLDSDDIWLPNHVVSLKKVLARGFQITYGTTLTIDKVNEGQFLIPEQGRGVEGNCFQELLKWCFLVPSAIAVSREAFQSVGGFHDGILGEDWTFFLKLASHYPFGFAGSEPITQRLLHHDSLCYISDKEDLLVSLKLIKAQLKNDSEISSEAIVRINAIEQWTTSTLASWTTVQEWYLAMKEEGMI